MEKKAEIQEKIEVIIASDHPAFRDGLCRLLMEAEGLEVIGQAKDEEEAVTLTREFNPEVIIMDINMPRVDGIEATKRIKHSSPHAIVLMISAYDYQTYLQAALHAGAAGYLTKGTPVGEMIDTIRLTHHRESVIDWQAASSIIFHCPSGKEVNKVHLQLSSGEMEALKLAAWGMTNRQIAQKLNISHQTVETHLRCIFTKLEVNNRTEDLLRALQEGWLHTSIYLEMTK